MPSSMPSAIDEWWLDISSPLSSTELEFKDSAAGILLTSSIKFADITSSSVKLLDAIKPFLRNKSMSLCALSKPLGAVFSSLKLCFEFILA